MKIKLMHPLISCICITQYRTDMLLSALTSYELQGYPNKELIISYPASDLETKDLISKILRYNNLNIRLTERTDEESLGLARNHAVEISQGEYICLWDDDDQSSPNRLYAQYNGMQGNNKYFQASILNHVLIYDAISKKSYLSPSHLWSGTLLCKKQHFLQYPCTDSNQFECEPLLQFLLSNKLLYEMNSNPDLYIFFYHNKNILSDFNLQYILNNSEPLDKDYLHTV